MIKIMTRIERKWYEDGKFWYIIKIYIKFEGYISKIKSTTSNKHGEVTN